MASYRGLRALHIRSLVMVVDARDPQFYCYLDLEDLTIHDPILRFTIPHTFNNHYVESRF